MIDRCPNTPGLMCSSTRYSKSHEMLAVYMYYIRSSNLVPRGVVYYYSDKSISAERRNVEMFYLAHPFV